MYQRPNPNKGLIDQTPRLVERGHSPVTRDMPGNNCDCIASDGTLYQKCINYSNDYISGIRKIILHSNGFYPPNRMIIRYSNELKPK